MFGSKQQQQQVQSRLDTKLPSSLPPSYATTAAAAAATTYPLQTFANGNGVSDIITPYLPPRPVTLRLVAVLCSPYLTPCVIDLEGNLKGDQGVELGVVQDVDPHRSSSQVNNRVFPEQPHSLASLIAVLLSAWIRLLKVVVTLGHIHS